MENNYPTQSYCNFLLGMGTYTVNIYRYKAVGANATSSVISTLAPIGLPIGAKGFPDRG